jgi:hypothetical protein
LIIASCSSTRLAPTEQTQPLFNYQAEECLRMQARLMDPSITPVQAAEITKNMEDAKCTATEAGK